ncbi:MAG TPA: glutathione S-transferase family protein [Polyangiaceae bacterium]|nr:glutathione S-transferase family protein [Polyangiaceae bacterium]
MKQKRAPSPTRKQTVQTADPPELYTFAISHFSEKVRWALDIERVPYREQRLIPGVHGFTTRGFAAKSSVPVLRQGNRVIQGSREILDALPVLFSATTLQPATLSPEQRAEIVEWEALFDYAFGLGVQRLAFDELLGLPREAVDFIAQDAPGWAKLLYRVGYPFVRRSVRDLYEIKPRTVDRARRAFADAIARTDKRLENCPFLVAEQLTRADITLAALLAPLCRPPQHLARWPKTVPGLQEFVTPFESGVTWKWVLRMYSERRHGSGSAIEQQADSARRRE